MVEMRCSNICGSKESLCPVSTRVSLETGLQGPDLVVSGTLCPLVQDPNTEVVYDSGMVLIGRRGAKNERAGI